ALPIRQARVRQRDDNANMEELLGLGAGDFEGVDFAASSDSDDEQVPNGATPDSPVDAASPTSGPTENGVAAAPTGSASSTAT
ncbi:unnamed protein product, partial [Ectocarpus sp. 12 AP-2014]